MSSQNADNSPIRYTYNWHQHRFASVFWEQCKYTPAHASRFRQMGKPLVILLTSTISNIAHRAMHSSIMSYSPETGSVPKNAHLFPNSPQGPPQNFRATTLLDYPHYGQCDLEGVRTLLPGVQRQL
jgi:hypothetical protein